VGTRQLAVSYDAGPGIILTQTLQQLIERGFLLGGTGVSFFTVDIVTSLVTDSDRATVVARSMNALHALREDRNDIAIAAHIVVVGGLPEALIACVDKAIDRKRSVAAGTGAVNHQIRDIFGF
jgi:hypothetical protein